jgi:hypothetical protein
MLPFAALTAAAFAGVAVAAWGLLRRRPMPLGTGLGATALALWLTGVTVAWLLEHEPPARGRSELVQSLDYLARPVPTEATPLGSAPPAPATGVQAASVESLVGGLEARLAAQPNDGNGWALLAQSYAYTANEEAVERSIRRAVELGVDEQALRERIAGAQRSAHPEWANRAIGTPRP